MIRVDLPDDNIGLGMSNNHYRKMIKMARQNIQGTWGYSSAIYEPRYTPSEYKTLVAGQQLSLLFEGSTALRAYFCFEDETDALQFRLAINESAIRVFMWPATTEFTITEFVSD